MINMKFERIFDAKVWKTGNALVITIPSATVKKFNIKEKEVLEVKIKR